MSADPLRRRTWDALRAVEEGRALDAALSAALDGLGVDRDRRLAVELIRGTLQWQGRYDHLIRRFSRRGALPRREILVVLRLGLHQLLACERIPAYAAVDQSVRLARSVGGARSAPYVNGLLQAVARELKSRGGDVASLRALFPDPGREPAAHLAAWQSHPRWLIERWLDRFGFAATERLCAFDNRRPPLACHVLPPARPEAVAQALAESGLAVRRGRLDDRALVIDSALSRASLRVLLARETSLIVQDEAVQAASRFLCAGASGPALDLCAAPGGKTQHLRVALCDGPTLIAADRSRARLDLVAATSARTRRAPQALAVADGRRAPFVDGAFATVLLDGPCSGTGVIRRHPEGRWRLGPHRLARSADRLYDLACEAVRLLRPGGRLLYATCSLEPEENEEVVERLREAYPDLAPDGASGGEDAQWRRLWLPQSDGADGFFAARLRRKART